MVDPGVRDVALLMGPNMVTLLGDWAGNVVTCGRLKDPPVELEDPYKTNTFTYIYMKLTLFLNNINQRSISM